MCIRDRVYGLEETKGFVNVTNTQSSNRRWNYQADGRGGSPATGVPDPTGALYVETSTAPTGPTSGRWFATRSPSITFSSNSVTLSMYRYGSNVGTCFCGVDIES